MAASSKFDLSFGSPDRPLYASGQRGSYSGALSDRSSSLHKNMENPILSALPGMSRSTSAVAQGDVTSFLQCLRFDPKAMVADHKFNRPMDFKRLAGLALGVSSDNSPSGSLKINLAYSLLEEVKCFKLGLQESSMKARERVKTFNEGLSVSKPASLLMKNMLSEYVILWLFFPEIKILSAPSLIFWLLLVLPNLPS